MNFQLLFLSSALSTAAMADIAASNNKVRNTESCFLLAALWGAYHKASLKFNRSYKVNLTTASQGVCSLWAFVMHVKQTYHVV